MPEKKFALIVASLRARSGKTLLARLIADYFLLAGETPEIFDTDAVERRFSTCFPERATVIDLERVTDQMKLFDTLEAPLPETQVIDLTHRSFKKFFKLMQEIDYAAVAKSRGVETAIFYIPDRDQESYEQGRLVRDHFKDCGFVLVENAHLGEIGKDMRKNNAYQALKLHHPRIMLPQLDPFFTGVIEDPKFSLSEFMRKAEGREPPPRTRVTPAEISLAYMSHEARATITPWLKQAFRELKRVADELQAMSKANSAETFGS